MALTGQIKRSGLLMLITSNDLLRIQTSEQGGSINEAGLEPLVT